MHSPEHQHGGGHERLSSAQEAAAEQAEYLRNRQEKAGEQDSEHSAERIDHARHEAEAAFAKEAGSERRRGGEPSGTPSPAAIRKITKREKQVAYKKTLKRAQSEMTPVGRTFSKVIHAPVIEKSSELIGSTIARPNAILFGSLTALIFGAVIYIIARTYGYRLSGFEAIGAYAIGWVIGIIIDYARLMLINSKRA